MTRRVGRWSCCRFVRLRWGSTASRQVVWGQHHQSWFVSIVITPLGAQISPSKNVNFQCASAAFTLPPEPMGFVVMCQLAPQAGPLLCGFCPSPRTFALRLPSDNPSRSCPCLRLVVNLLYVSITVLPQGTFTPSVHAHVGHTHGGQNRSLRSLDGAKSAPPFTLVVKPQALRRCFGTEMPI